MIGQIERPQRQRNVPRTAVGIKQHQHRRRPGTGRGRTKMPAKAAVGLIARLRRRAGKRVPQAACQSLGQDRARAADRLASLALTAIYLLAGLAIRPRHAGGPRRTMQAINHVRAIRRTDALERQRRIVTRR